MNTNKENLNFAENISKCLRGFKKKSGVTLKTDYKKLALEETKRAERLKKQLQKVLKQREKTLDQVIKSTLDTEFLQRKLQEREEKGDSIRKRRISFIFITGAVAGWCLESLIWRLF